MAEAAKTKAAAKLGRRISDAAATLWDLLGLADTAVGDASPPERAARPQPIDIDAGTESGSKAIDDPARRRPPSTGKQALYDEIVRSMKRIHGVRVVRWRSSTSGCAWQVHYADGTTARLIESPYPRGPMSCAVFLHEIGHHAIGFGTYRPRCLEEYHAWRWSFETMLAEGVNVTETVRRRRDEALHYAIRKAVRRGLKRLPVELTPFVRVPDRSAPPLPALLTSVSADDAA